MLAEVSDVLSRPQIQKWISAELADRFLATLWRTVEIVHDPDSGEVRTRDTKDDHLVAPAREHRADYIVTGDEDLVEWPEQTYQR